MNDEMPQDAPTSDWPCPGDILFTAGSDWWHNACVGWSQNPWIGYAEGYKLAGDRLVQHVTETESKQDFLVYPIVFLYRQSLEIALKYILLNGFQLLDRGELPQAFTKHRLVPLWQHCRSILEQVWPTGPKETLDAVSQVIQQFESKDPGSTAFRYPTDTSGAVSISTNEHINLRNLAEVVNRVYSLLDASGSAINEYLQQKSEMESCPL